MSLSSIALNQIVVMFLLILIGYICYKTKLIDEATNKKLSDILLNLINPIVILVSYQRDANIEVMKGLLISFVLAAVTHFFGILASYTLIRKKHSDNVLERFSCIYTNCGFMGIPIVGGMFGSEGVFYLTAYITVFNIFVWTQGVTMMVGKQDKKMLLKTLISPTIIAVFIGLILFIAQIKLPDVMNQALNSISATNTPFAMLVAGVTIAQTNIVKIFSKVRIYYVCFIKLLVIPVLLLLIYSRFSMDKIVITTALLASACPTGATGTLFAIKYGKNAYYASELFAITSLLSLATIPLVMQLTELII